LSFHNSSFCLKIPFNVNGKAKVWHTNCFVCFFFTKEQGKEKTSNLHAPSPFTATSCILIQTGLPFAAIRLFFAKKEKCKTKQILWIFICLLKKQDACHVDKLAPSCLPWRDFNDLSNLVRNAHTIKLVVIVCKVLTPHQNISMYKTHGTKKKDKSLSRKHLP